MSIVSDANKAINENFLKLVFIFVLFVLTFDFFIFPEIKIHGSSGISDDQLNIIGGKS